MDPRRGPGGPRRDSGGLKTLAPAGAERASARFRALLKDWVGHPAVAADPSLRVLLVQHAAAVRDWRVTRAVLTTEADPEVWARVLALPDRELRVQVLALRGAQPPTASGAGGGRPDGR